MEEPEKNLRLNKIFNYFKIFFWSTLCAISVTLIRAILYYYSYSFLQDVLFMMCISFLSLMGWSVFSIGVEVYKIKKKPVSDLTKQDKAKINNFSLFFLAMITNQNERDAALGCAEERFKKEFKKFGKFYAYCLFWRDVFAALPPAIIDKIGKLLKLVFNYVVSR